MTKRTELGRYGEGVPLHERRPVLSEFQPSRQMCRLMRLAVASASSAMPGDQELTPEEYKAFARAFAKDPSGVDGAVRAFITRLETPYAHAVIASDRTKGAVEDWMGYVHRKFQKYSVLRSVFWQFIGVKDENDGEVAETHIARFYRKQPQAPTMQAFVEAITASGSPMPPEIHIPPLHDGFCKLFYGKRYEYTRAWEGGKRSFIQSQHPPLGLEEAPQPFRARQEDMDRTRYVRARHGQDIVMALLGQDTKGVAQMNLWDDEQWNAAFAELKDIFSNTPKKVPAMLQKFLRRIPTPFTACRKQDKELHDTSGTRVLAWLETCKRESSSLQKTFLGYVLNTHPDQVFTIERMQAWYSEMPTMAQVLRAFARWQQERGVSDDAFDMGHFLQMLYGMRYAYRQAWDDVSERYGQWLERTAPRGADSPPAPLSADMLRLSIDAPPLPAHLPEKEGSPLLLQVVPLTALSKLLYQDPTRGALLENHSRTSKRGSDWMYDKGIAPAFSTTLDKQTWYFSKPFLMERDGAGNRHHRFCVVVYAPIEVRLEQGGRETHWVARPYYVSNSHGLWRYMNGYIARDQRNGRKVITYFGKGYQTDHTLNLPFALQAQLTRTMCAQMPIQEKPDAEDIFLGISDNLSARLDLTYGDEVDEERPRRPVATPRHRSARPVHGRQGERSIRPERVQVENQNDAPDFRTCILSWSIDSELYEGQVSFDVFSSRDGRTHYAFAHDSHGRRWLAGTEDVTAETGATGLRTHWVDMGAAAIPAMEYILSINEDAETWLRDYAVKEEDGWNMRGHGLQGHYADVSSFTNAIPIVAQYRGWLNEQKRRK